MRPSSWLRTWTSRRRRAAAGINSRSSPPSPRGGGRRGPPVAVSPPVMSTPPAVVALESVWKRYGAKTIIHDLSFTVGKGEIVGFLGPNGAGKTTTMRMIAGFTTATSGRVTVAGYDMATRNAEAARHIGYLAAPPPLYDTLDVSAYLRFVARAKGVPRSAVPAELERVGAACRLEAGFRPETFN